jgi:hypothetical protein
MRVIDLILLIIAVVCFALAAFGTPAKVNLIAVGLAALALVPLLTAVQQVK